MEVRVRIYLSVAHDLEIFIILTQLYLQEVYEPQKEFHCPCYTSIHLILVESG